MVLYHVADSAGFIVEGPAALHAKILRHRDLNTLDIIAIPEGLHERICKTKCDHILHRCFSQEVIDAKDRGLRKRRKQNTVEVFRGFEVVSERFLYDDASALAASGCDELLYDFGK